MTNLARQITRDEAAAYRKAGVVLLRGVLNLRSVNELRRSIDEATRSLGASRSGYNMSRLTDAYEAMDGATIAGADGGQHDISGIMAHMRESGKPLLLDAGNGGKRGDFLLDTGVVARLRDFRRFAQQGPAAEIAGALLESDTVRFYDDQLFVKEPGARERTAFHQDATYFEADGDQCCVMWIAVDPVTAETGAMVYWRGSHLDHTLYQPNVFVSQAPLPGAQGVPLPDIEGRPDDFDLVSFDVEPGDVLVHHYRTVHGSGGNSSKYQVRRAASLRYCGDDMRFCSRPWAPRRLHLKCQLSEGDALCEPDFPVVWRRHALPKAA